ncbi:ImmA/IrrE family metallo-endopeptidase [Polaromonas sp.]|uniref:ImmA/IrrE family metallo-endopeptidase n=1 Tax=Polaromonas sp. TaxID=1869339 RepID=UPI003263B0E8
MSPGKLAEARIQELGISHPREIAVELIAMDAGMRVEYESLDGCEAMLVGVGNRAVATIKPSSSRGRERYSIGHELGHWEMHRGRSFRCRVDDPDQNFSSDKVLEKEADSYSAHLLMPSFMFEPAVKVIGDPSFQELDELANGFETSMLATAMRLADIDALPVILACFTATGLRWSKAAAHVPRRWFLRNKLDDDSFAFEYFENGREHPRLGKQPAETWFENLDADKYEVRECCRPGRNGELLVLLYLESKMLYAGFDPHVGNRKFTSAGSYVTRK